MNHLLLGMAGYLAADIAVEKLMATSTDSTKKLMKIVGCGVAVWAGHKYVFKGA